MTTKRINTAADEPEDEWGAWPSPPTSCEFPAIKMVDLGDVLAVYAEMPGVDDSNFEVSVTQDVLTIRGSRKRPPHGFVAQKSERVGGSFDRTIKLLSKVDPKSACASMETGILTVTFSKVHAKKRYSIPVRAI